MPEKAESSGSKVDSTPLGECLSRSSINFLWFWKLRWAAVVGQLSTVLIVDLGLEVDIPLALVIPLIAVTAVSNLALGWMHCRSLKNERVNAWAADGDLMMSTVTAWDIVTLTALLLLTGAASNPFAIFYFVHLVIAAVILPSRATGALTMQSILCFSSLFLGSADLEVFIDPSLNYVVRRGMLVSFSVATVIIVYFVIHVGKELGDRDRELEANRRRRAQSERVESLLTLAAGAAHELATPLSTIAVAAGELERGLKLAEVDANTLEDITLIRSEVRRCRNILDHMSAEAGELVGECPSRVAVVSYLNEVLDPLHAAARIDLMIDPALADSELEGPPVALRRALRGLVKNALDASTEGQSVSVIAEKQNNDLEFKVVDSGSGMSTDTLAKSGDPFFTTKEPGRGMGLGLYLTRTVIERLNGKLQIESKLGGGTTAQVQLPLVTDLLELPPSPLPNSPQELTSS